MPFSDHRERLPFNAIHSSDGSERHLWVYTGDNRFVTAKDGKTVTVSEMETFALLDGVLAKKCFCVLRPSMVN